MIDAVARQTQLVHATEFQQSRISRTVRRMTRRASFGLEWRVLVSERTLLVCVAFYAGRIGAGCQPGLLEFKTAMWVMAVAALHRAFEHLVMKRLVEVGLNFVVAAYAQLRLADLE